MRHHRYRDNCVCLDIKLHYYFIYYQQQQQQQSNNNENNNNMLDKSNFEEKNI